MKPMLPKHNPPSVLAVLPAFIPSTNLIIIKPLIRLHQMGKIRVKIVLEKMAHLHHIEKADLVVFCRNTEPAYSSWHEKLLKLNKPYIYDIDDNFFELPCNSEIGLYHRDPSRLAMLEKYISQASLVRVYSAPMQIRASALNNLVERVNGPIDTKLISNSKSKQPSDKIKIVYATSRKEDELSEIFLPALEQILQKYNGSIEVHFWGYNPSEFLTNPNVIIHPMILNYDKFLRRFSTEGFDIGLAPLSNSLFYRSKTNNKFREYGACKIAGIYSDVEVYSECVVNGQTGLLVNNDTLSWYEALTALIEDKHLLNSIRIKAQTFVNENYAQHLFEEVWLDQILRVVHNCKRKLTRETNSTSAIDEPIAVTASASKPLQNLKTLIGNVIRKLTILCHNPRVFRANLQQYFNIAQSTLRIQWQTSRMYVKALSLIGKHSTN